jgi:hypothetical protein
VDADLGRHGGVDIAGGSTLRASGIADAKLLSFKAPPRAIPLVYATLFPGLALRPADCAGQQHTVMHNADDF